MVGEIATAYVQLEARGGAPLSSSINRAMPTSTLNAAGQDGGAAYAGGVGDGVTKSKGRLSSALGGALKLGAVGAAAGTAVGLSFAKGAYDAYGESRKVAALTASAIKATGGAANVTAADVANLAGAISKKTYVDDEMIQTGSNMILTFKNVRNEAGKNNKIFDEATQAAVDLSAAGFGSVEGASVMLGKALNDPLKGMSALGKSGVTFTDDQKKMVEGMIEAGDILGAQKIILGEVEGQVGGAAAAQADAADKIGLAWGNFQEDVGGKVAPVFDDIMSGAADGLAAISGLLNGEGIPGLGGGNSVLTNGMENISEVTGHVLDAGREVWDGLKAGWGELTESVGGILEEHGPMIENIQDVLGDVASEAMDVLAPALKWLAEEGLDAIGEGFEFMFDTVKAGGNVMFGFSEIALAMAGTTVEAVTDMAANVIDGFIAMAVAADAIPGVDMGDTIATLGMVRERVEGYGDDFQAVTDNVRAGLREQQWEWNLTASEAAELGNRIRMLPDNVETMIKVPGAYESYERVRDLQKTFDLTPEEVLTVVQASGTVLTMRQIRKLADQVEMTPKQIALLVKQSGGVKTVGDIRKVLDIANATDKKDIKPILKALGVDVTVRDFERVKDKGMDVDKLRPTPRVGVDTGDFFGILGRVSQGLRDIDGDSATTYIYTQRRDSGRALGGNIPETNGRVSAGRSLTVEPPTPAGSLTGYTPRRAGRLALVEGRLTIDEDGSAWIRGVARDEIDDASDFAGTLTRMGG